VLALLGCSGDDEETESARKAASELSAAVEQISDGLTTEGANALTALNKVIDESIEPRGAIAVLKCYSDAAKSAEMRLGRLKAPASAESTADGLAFLIAALERSIEFTATDIRIARREREDIPAVARSGDRVISAPQSGVRALSLALRALANVSVNGTSGWGPRRPLLVRVAQCPTARPSI